MEQAAIVKTNAMVNGVHFFLYGKGPEADRAFTGGVLELQPMDRAAPAFARDGDIGRKTIY